MGIKTYKPTSPARRYYSVSDFKELTKVDAGDARCSSTRHRTGGRNNHGRITSRFRGGGHKQRYRIIDFRARQDRRPREGRVDRIRSEPHRAHRAPPLRRRREALHPRARRHQGRRHDRREPQRRHQARQQPAAPPHPARHDDPQRRAEEGQGRAARVARPASPRSSWRRTATTRRSACPSGEVRKVHLDCQATIGQVSNVDHANISPRQGRSYALARPAPAQPRRHDEPGRSPDGRRRGSHRGGRHPCSPWGQLSKGLKTRNNKRTDGMIVKRRGTEGLSHAAFNQEGSVRRRSPHGEDPAPPGDQARRRSSRPGRAARRSLPRPSASRSPCTTAASSCRCSSRRTWSGTSSASSRRRARSTATRATRRPRSSRRHEERKQQALLRRGRASLSNGKEPVL